MLRNKVSKLLRLNNKQYLSKKKSKIYSTASGRFIKK